MTSQPIRAGIAAATAAGVFAIAGCGSDDDTTATAAKATALAGADRHARGGDRDRRARARPVPAALRGRWRRTMRAADFGTAAAFPLGVWSIDVGRKGATDVYAPRKNGGRLHACSSPSTGGG